MLSSRIWRILLLFFCVSSLGIVASEEVDSIEATYSGFVCNAEGYVGLIDTASGTYRVRLGTKLGMYEVDEVSSQKIVVSGSGERYDLILEDAPKAPPRPVGKEVFVHASYCDLGQLCLALSELAGKPIVVGSDVSAGIELSASFESPEAALSALPETVEDVKYEFARIDDFWVVASEYCIDPIRSLLARGSGRGPKLKMNYLNADLAYVLSELSKEMDVSLIACDVEGSVNIHATDVSAEDLLAAILGAQEIDYGYHLDSRVLAVANPILLEATPPDIPTNSPPVSMYPDGFDFERNIDDLTAPLSTMVDRWVGAAGFTLDKEVADVNLALRVKECPASVALYWALRIWGYDAAPLHSKERRLLRTPAFMGSVAESEKNLERALRLVDSELVASRQIRGEEHADTGRLLKIRGDVLRRASDYADAGVQYREASDVLAEASDESLREAYVCRYLSLACFGRAGQDAEAKEVQSELFGMVGSLKTEEARMEYLLEEVAAAPMVVYLMRRYPELFFVPHPTMNGFYAQGPESSLVELKRILPQLDRIDE